MNIYNILREISDDSSSNGKMQILSKYSDDALLRRVLYMAYSKRIKFYIKQIPEYKNGDSESSNLSDVIDDIEKYLCNRIYTGDDARLFLSHKLASLNKEDSNILERIIKKDLRIGMGSRNINKVIDGLIETTPYQGAKPYSAKLVDNLFKKNEYLLSNIKMDGRYCNCIIRSGEYELESRQGEPTIINNSKFLYELPKFKDCVLNGELTMYDFKNNKKLPRYLSNGIIASIIDIEKKRKIRSEEDTNKEIVDFEYKTLMSIEDALDMIVYTLWDIIPIECYFQKYCDTPYEDRFSELNDIIKSNNFERIFMISNKIVYNKSEALDHFTEAINDQEEGTILKCPKSPWKDGKPIWQIKLKKEFEVDLEICGYNMGTGKNCNLISSLNCRTSDGMLFARPTGISEKMMKFITENRDMLLFTIVQVKCSGLSRNKIGEYSLLHPVFEELRYGDKDVANSLSEVIEIDNMANFL